LRDNALALPGLTARATAFTASATTRAIVSSVGGSLNRQGSLSYGARIPYPDASQHELEPLVERIKRERGGKLLSSYPR